MNYLKQVEENIRNGFYPSLYELNNHFLSLDMKDTSRVVAYSRFKTKLKAIDPDNEFFKSMFLPAQIRNAVKKTNEKSKENVSMTSIKNTIVNKLLKLHTSNKPEDQLIWLLLVSGRRLYEVKDLDLVKESSNSIMFSGQLKSDTPTPYEVTLLKSFNVFSKVFKTFNENTLDFDTVSRKSSQILKYLTGNENIHLHDLRRIYILKLYSQIGGDATFPNFISTHLGHSGDGSASYYQNFRIQM